VDLSHAPRPDPDDLRVAAPVEGERSIATAAHLGAISGLVVPLANVAVPGVFWGMQLHRSTARADGAVPFAVHHAREAFRFHLLMGLVQLALLALAESRPRGLLEAFSWFAGLSWVAAFLWLTVGAARRAHAGELATYPWPRGSAPRPAPADPDAAA
jgi:uncharacterized Tic20 family protein